MSSKIFLCELFIFCAVGLLSYQSVFAKTETCGFSDSEIEGVEVGQIGDRQIYTLFTPHPNNGNDEKIHRILNSHKPMDAVTLLNQLIEQYQSIIESEQSDAQKIIELAESGKINWIGIESTNRYASYANVTDNSLNDRDFSRTASNYLQYQDVVSRNFNHLPGWNADKTAQLLFLIFPAYIIVHINHPEIFHKMRVYPLEDRNLRHEASDQHDDRDYRHELLLNDSRLTDYQYSEIIFFVVNEYLIPRPLLIPDSEIEDLPKRLGVSEDAHTTLTNIKMFMRAYNEVTSLILRRDTAVVQSILDLPGNGLILFGAAHGHGIKQGLITACQNQLAMNGLP